MGSGTGFTLYYPDWQGTAEGRTGGPLRLWRGAASPHTRSKARMRLSSGAERRQPGKTAKEMGRDIHPHRTLSEAVAEAALASLGHALHI